jgi:hypothetical protein
MKSLRVLCDAFDLVMSYVEVIGRQLRELQEDVVLCDSQRRRRTYDDEVFFE